MNANETSYQDVKNIMTNSIEEFFHKIEVKKGTKYSRLEITSSKDWLTPKKATYGNPLNTYSHIYKPVLYDYIFHRAKGKNVIITNLFKVSTFLSDPGIPGPIYGSSCLSLTDVLQS